MMDRADIIRMAAAAGLGQHLPAEPGLWGAWIGTDLTALQHFSELVLEPERTARKAAQVTAEGLKTELARVKGFEKRYEAHRDVALAEREACAEEADYYAKNSRTALQIAQAIRARPTP